MRGWRTIIACAAGLVTLGGCVTGPARPGAALVVPPSSFTSQQADAERFNPQLLLPTGDPAFNELAAQARASAPSLQAAIARIEAARAGLDAANASRRPDVSAAASVSGQQLATTTAPFGDRTRAQLQAGLDARWEADLFGRLRASQQAARARLDAAGSDAAAVRLALVSDIAVAVIDYRDAARRRTVIEQEVSSARDLLTVTRARSAAGVISGFDAARAASLVAEATSRRTELAGDQGSALGRLVTLTALDGARVLAALATADSPAARPLPPAAVPADVLQRRPDVLAAAARLAAADADLAAAAAARFPRLTLTGALGALALGPGSLFNPDSFYASLGSSIAGPLFDFGRTAAQTRQRRAAATEAFETYRTVVFAAVGEVEAALAQLAAERAGATARDAQLDADTTTLAIARERYRLGLTDFLAVIDAQRRLNTTRISVQTSIASIARTNARLFRALAGPDAP